MADMKDWSTNANEALQIRLCSRAGTGKAKDVSFQPAFTYPVYGDEETIFGYRGLKIKLDFTADTLQPSLDVSFTSQFEALGETQPDDVEGPLHEILPGLNTDSSNNKPNGATKDDEIWQPPGELVHKYEVTGRTFGIWSATLTDAKAKEVFRNMQALVLFFIEGGSLIEIDDPDWTMARWRVFFLYAIDGPSASPSYSLAGYSTAYTLFFLDPSIGSPKDNYEMTPDDILLQKQLPSRSRISQFLILPPYQHSGHGATLYNTIFTYFLQLPNTHEIPVEDPNESFDDLRDQSDLIRLRTNLPTFKSLRINASATLPTSKTEKFPTSTLLSASLTTQLRKSAKIAPRQFARLVEMQLLSSIPARHRHISRTTRKDKASDENDRAYYFWRLLVKQRLYKHNRDQLIQLDLAERIKKLEETLMAVERDYVRLLDAAERRAKRMEDVIRALRKDVHGNERGAERGDVDDSEVEIVSASTKSTRLNGTNGVKTMPERRKGVKRRIIDDDDDEDEDEVDGDDDGDEETVNETDGNSQDDSARELPGKNSGGQKGKKKKKVKI